MYAKIAILLLGFAVAAYAQCSCGGVKQCFEEKKPPIPQVHTDCIAKCKSKLPAAAPNAKPDAVFNCAEQKLKTEKGAELDCILHTNGVVCTRKRRQSSPIGVDSQAQAGAQTNTQAQAAGQQVGAQTSLNVAAGTSANIEGLMQPYFQCVHDCGTEGLNLSLIAECSQTCSKMTLESLQAAAQTCKADQTFANAKSQAKSKLCACIRDATGQSTLAC